MAGKDLISQANNEFKSREYAKCLETLALVDPENEGNTKCKLEHNRAVVEFYKSDCKDHAGLLYALSLLDMNDVDQLKSYPIGTYNKSVIYFHRHMYQTAFETISPLVEKLDSLDERMAARVGILMLKLLLATNQLNKAQGFRDSLQIQLGISADTLVAEESTFPGRMSKVEGFTCAFHLLSSLIDVLNRKAVVIPEDESAELAALKAHQYYIMKDFQMSAKQLKKISAEDCTNSAHSNELNTCIANNMGVIHLRVRHYAIAAKFFQTAINFDKHVTANLRNTSLHQMGSVHSCEILYNLGISMLHLRRPKEAFQCFIVPLKSYHNNPRLWMRIAESCIMNNEINNSDEEKSMIATMSSDPSISTETSRQRMKYLYSSNNQSAAVPEPNLEFAALSLRNALALTNFYRANFLSKEEAAENDTQSWNNMKDNNFCSPSKPISKESFDKMLCAIYAAYSYVSLRLGDYVQALELAEELLKVDNVSDAHKLLSHMYSGEALMMMEKFAEARPHLEPSFVTTLNEFDFETKNWLVKSLDAAQNVVKYNLAVAMVLQADFESAKSILNSCTHPIVSAKVKSLKLYINIKSGIPS